MASSNTGIEWTDKTWNPTTGCDKVSSGCKNCYAEAITERFPQNFPNGFQLTLHPERLGEPKRWRKPSRVFVNSMSDLFHENVPVHFLKQVFQVMGDTPWHIYQILTKRHERLLELSLQLTWPENVWMGVSVESQSYVKRVDFLRQIDAPVRFLSCEPLLGPLEINLEGINWVIVGGESGTQHRPIQEDWVRSILAQCQQEKVPFFFKQWGGIHSKSKGRLLDGRIWDEMPTLWENHKARWTEEMVRSAKKEQKNSMLMPLCNSE